MHPGDPALQKISFHRPAPALHPVSDKSAAAGFAYGAPVACWLVKIAPAPAFQALAGAPHWCRYTPARQLIRLSINVSWLPPSASAAALIQLEADNVAYAVHLHGFTVVDFRLVFKFGYRGHGFAVENTWRAGFNNPRVGNRAQGGDGKFHHHIAFNTLLRSPTGVVRRHFHNG